MVKKKFRGSLDVEAHNELGTFTNDQALKETMGTRMSAVLQALPQEMACRLARMYVFMLITDT